MTRFDFAWKFIERPKRIIEGWIKHLFRWNNAILIQRDVNKHRNEIVIETPFRILMLLGWTDQYKEEDYYWVTYDPRDFKSPIHLESCCGGFIYLKNQLSMFDYEQLRNIWNMNTKPLDEILNMVKDKKIILK